MDMRWGMCIYTIDVQEHVVDQDTVCVTEKNYTHPYTDSVQVWDMVSL